MKKLLTLIGISSVLFGCGNETAEINNEQSDFTKYEESSQEIEEKESTSQLSTQQKRNVIEVAGELNDSLTYYQASYVEEFHAIVVLINDDVILNEYLRAVEGQQDYVNAFRSTGNTLQDTSKKIVRDSGVDDLALIFAAPLEDNNASIIFKFENGIRIIDVFEKLGYY